MAIPPEMLQQHAWLERHREADQMVFPIGGGDAVCAIYISPEANRKIELRRLFAAILEHRQEAADLLGDES
jgi:hypothetical protein